MAGKRYKPEEIVAKLRRHGRPHCSADPGSESGHPGETNRAAHRLAAIRMRSLNDPHGACCRGRPPGAAESSVPRVKRLVPDALERTEAQAKKSDG